MAGRDPLGSTRRSDGIERIRTFCLVVCLALFLTGRALGQDDQAQPASFAALADYATELKDADRHVALLAKVRAAEADLSRSALRFDDVKNLYRAADRLAQYGGALSLDERVELIRISVAATDRLLELSGEDRQAGVQMTRVRARNRLAEYLLTTGETAEAVEIAESALQIESDRFRPDVLETLIELHLARNDHANALQVFEEWQAHKEEFPLDYAEKRARLYLGLGLTNEALRWVDKALESASTYLAAQSDGPLGAAAADLVRIHATAINLELEIGDWLSAVEKARAAAAEERFFERRPDLRIELLRLEGVALTHLERIESGRSGEAEDVLERALALDPAPIQRLYLLLRLAELDITDGRFDQALVRLDEVRELSPQLSGDERLRLETLTTRLAIERDDERENLRARWDQMRAVAEELRAAWRELPIRPGGLGMLRNLNRRSFFSQYTSLAIRVLGDEDGAREALEEIFRVQALGSLARKLELDAPTLEEVRSKLCSNRHGVLLLLPAPFQSHVFAFDDERLIHRVTEPSDVTKAKLKRWESLLTLPLRRSVTSEDRALERALAHEISEQLIPSEVQGQLAAWDGFHIVGEDDWTDLTFAALPLCGSRYAVTRFALGCLPSVPFGLYLRDRAEKRALDATADLWLVAEARASENVSTRWPVPPLTLSAPSLEKLCSSFSEERVHVFRGEHATREVLERAELASVAVLQVLTHGVLNFDRVRPACLVLTPIDDQDTGLFDADDVERGSAPRAVLLTACRSADSPSRTGDEDAASLGSAWLFAGSDVVLHATEDLLYGPTIDLSAEWLAAVADGDTPGQALRQAAQALAKEGAEPCRFAVLRLSGLANRSLFERRERSTGMWWISAAGVALLGLALLARRSA